MNETSKLPVAFSRTDEAFGAPEKRERPAAPSAAPANQAAPLALMTFGDFHNGLRILLNIDFDEFSAVIPQNTTAKFAKFLDDPHRFFIRCDDETAGALWSIIERRTRRA